MAKRARRYRTAVSVAVQVVTPPAVSPVPAVAVEAEYSARLEGTAGTVATPPDCCSEWCHGRHRELEDGGVVLDAQCRPEWVNPGARRILGLPPDQTPTLLHGLDLSSLFPTIDARGTPMGPGRAHIEQVLARGLVISSLLLNALLAGW